MNKNVINCAICEINVKDRACRIKNGKGPSFCPTLRHKEILEETLKEYKKNDIREFARQASIQESECYDDRDKKPFVKKCIKTRVEEICEFAKKMKFKKLGIAFCSGMKNEAKTLHRILRGHDFEVVSVICKAGSLPKETLGLKEYEKVRIGEYESMCNPINQAKVLNGEKTDFNILLGLCVGHDSLFFKYSKAPVTVLAAKDRVLGHNPLAALYNVDSYYEHLKK